MFPANIYTRRMTMWKRLALVGIGAVIGALGSAYALGYRKGLEEKNCPEDCEQKEAEKAQDETEGEAAAEDGEAAMA